MSSAKSTIDSMYLRLFDCGCNEYARFYDDIPHPKLREIFMKLHELLVFYLERLNEKLPTGDEDRCFSRSDSENLIRCIARVNELYQSLAGTVYEFELSDYNGELFKTLFRVLKASELNALPHKMDRIKISYREPMFNMTRMDEATKLMNDSTALLSRINEIKTEAMDKIEYGEYDAAIALAYNLLEKTLAYAVKQKGENVREYGNVPELYERVCTLYNMQIGSSERVNKLLCGMRDVVLSVSEMRDVGGVKKGAYRTVDIFDYHARFAVDSAVSVSGFLVSVITNNLSE